MDKMYTRAVLTRTRAGDDGKRVYTFLATTEAVDRQNEILSLDGWELDNYRRNPVVIDSHNYGGIENIVGTASEVRQTERGLEVDISFNMTPRGRLAEQLVEEGNLRAVSVGFISKEMEWDSKGAGPAKHTKKELLEISVVAVPANPEALRLRDLQARQVHPPRRTPIADEDAEWDAAAEVRAAEGEAQLFREGELDGWEIDAKMGRVLSRANEARIRSAVAALQEVLDSLGEPEPEETGTINADVGALLEFVGQKGD